MGSEQKEKQCLYVCLHLHTLIEHKKAAGTKVSGEILKALKEKIIYL